MYKLALIPLLLLLAACDCPYKNHPEEEKALYRECLQLLSDARKGSSYTTNDDEDYDEAIEECRISAGVISSYKECKEEKKDGS